MNGETFRAFMQRKAAAVLAHPVFGPLLLEARQSEAALREQFGDATVDSLIESERVAFGLIHDAALDVLRREYEREQDKATGSADPPAGNESTQQVNTEPMRDTTPVGSVLPSTDIEVARGGLNPEAPPGPREPSSPPDAGGAGPSAPSPWTTETIMVTPCVRRKQSPYPKPFRAGECGSPSSRMDVETKNLMM